MDNLAAVDAILKHEIECSPGDWSPSAVNDAVRPNPALALDSAGRKLLLEIPNRLKCQVSLEDVDYEFGFMLVYDQLAIFDVISEGWHSAHPHAFLLGGRDLV